MNQPLLRLAVFLLAATPLTAAPDLQSALDEVSAGCIESDVQFLASEALGGRGTPSPGLEVTALYIKARLERLAYVPGGREGYWHEYPLVMTRIDATTSRIELSSENGESRLAFGEHYFLRSSELSPLDLSGSVVSIGDGSPESLEQCDLEGRWALLLDEGRSTKRALEAVREAGGLGLVLAAGEGYGRKSSYAERFRPTVRGMTEGRVMKVEHSQALSASSLPRLWLSETGLAQLLALATPFEGEEPPAGSELGVELHEVRVPSGGEVTVRNVCGFLPGTDPVLAAETIVVSAHYDHLGERSGNVHPGADDNASGTAGLLALADALKERGPLKRSVLLLWLSGEEKGLWGSEAWAKDAWLPGESRAVANINLDMIGRTAPAEIYLTPSRAHSHFNSVAELAYELAELEGFDKPEAQDQYWRSSDQFNFSSVLGIPVAYLSSGDHDDYHTPSDTADKIDSEKIARTTRLVLRMLERLQDFDEI